MFVEPLVNRVKQAASHGSVLSFPGAYQDQAYLAYSRFALGGAAADEVSRLQHMVPEGETLVAWISLPVYLDFGRNRIFDVQPAGLGSRLDGSSLLPDMIVGGGCRRRPGQDPDMVKRRAPPGLVSRAVVSRAMPA